MELTGKITVASNVYTGGGNSSNHINKFDPVNREVYANETVQWSNPTAGKPYPHMVTIIGNQSPPILESKISNFSRILQTTDFQSVNFQQLSNNLNKFNSENTMHTANSTRGFNATSVLFPSVINSSGLKVSYLDPYGNWADNGAVYNMTGKETFLNSGLIWNGDMKSKGFFNVKTFTVKFMNPGTYHYQCLIHPEMKGTITVKP
jgi:plastocyanin